MDQRDREILAALQREGRISNLALSRRARPLALGHDRPRAASREERGDPRLSRDRRSRRRSVSTVQALTVVKLREHSEQAIREFEEAVKGVVGVRACYHVTGQFDMVMMLALRDLTHLAQMIRVDLARIPGVMQFETMLIMAESVADQGWPLVAEE